MLTNRAFLYGDGLFETMRVYKGQILWLTDHAARLNRGLTALGLVLETKDELATWLQNKVIELLSTESATNHRVRGTFFRAGGGLYTPEEDGCAYLFDSVPLAIDPYPFSTKGLSIGIAEGVRLDQNRLSPHKTLNALPYVLAGREKQAQGWEDCLLLNTAGRVAEAQAANVFLWRDGVVYTPDLHEGCIAGVLRQQVLRLLAELGWKVIEGPIEITQLKHAQEIWLTNAIQGIRWVASIEGIQHHRYQGKQAQYIQQALQGKLL